MRTNFTLIEKDTKQRTVDGGFEIGVGKKDIRGLPAKLQRDALHRIGGLLDDDLADFGASGECDLIYVRMSHQRRATCFTKSGDDVHYSRGQSNFRKPFGHLQGRKRSLLGRLQHAGAARGQRRREFPCRHEQWIIPGNDLSGNTDRLLQSKADRVVWDRINIAQNLGCKSAVVFKAGRNIGDIVFCFDNRLPSIAAFEFGKHH